MNSLKIYKSTTLKASQFSSEAEFLMAKVLKEMLMHNIFSEKYFIYNRAVKVKGVNRYIDFEVFVAGKCIWIEYNGYQHYGLCKLNEFKQEKLDAQKQRDRAIRKYAKQYDISVVVYGVEKNDIKYTAEFNSMNIAYPVIKRDLTKAVNCEFVYNGRKKR